jgi:hypothetical protein
MEQEVNLNNIEKLAVMSRETLFSVAETNLLILFKERIALYFGNSKTHIGTLWAKARD